MLSCKNKSLLSMMHFSDASSVPAPTTPLLTKRHRLFQTYHPTSQWAAAFFRSSPLFIKRHRTFTSTHPNFLMTPNSPSHYVGPLVRLLPPTPPLHYVGPFVPLLPKPSRYVAPFVRLLLKPSCYVGPFVRLLPKPLRYVASFFAASPLLRDVPSSSTPKYRLTCPFF